MAKQIKQILKGYFETGDVPTQGQYRDLIDSYVSLNDTEVNPQIINTNFSASGYISTETHITASGNITASGTNHHIGILKIDNDINGVTVLNNALNSTRFAIISDDGRSSQHQFQGRGNQHSILASGSLHNIGIGHNPDGNSSKLTVSGSINVIEGEITASGNISSSENVIAKKLIASNATTLRISEEYATGNFVMDDNAGDNVDALSIYADEFISRGNYTVLGDTTLGNALTDKINLKGTVTASGNISASGNITADTLISNNIIFTSGSTSIKIEAPDEPAGAIAGADLIFEAGNAFGSNFKGGNITIQAGKGSGAGDGGDITINAGGGIPSGSVNINALKIILELDNIPTSDPNLAGQIWRDGTDLKISLG